jgi:hypothetical protein
MNGAHAVIWWHVSAIDVQNNRATVFRQQGPLMEHLLAATAEGAVRSGRAGIDPSLGRTNDSAPRITSVRGSVAKGNHVAGLAAAQSAQDLPPSFTAVVQLTCHPLFVPKHQKTALSAVMRYVGSESLLL